MGYVVNKCISSVIPTRTWLEHIRNLTQKFLHTVYDALNIDGLYGLYNIIHSFSVIKNIINTYLLHCTILTYTYKKFNQYTVVHCIYMYTIDFINSSLLLWKWDSDKKSILQGFELHVISAASEWIMCVSQLSFFLTFVKEFKHYALSTPEVSHSNTCLYFECPNINA